MALFSPPPGILSYLVQLYAPLVILAYGSYTDGSHGPGSDFDALLLTPGGTKLHDVSFVGEVQLGRIYLPRRPF